MSNLAARHQSRLENGDPLAAARGIFLAAAACAPFWAVVAWLLARCL